MLVHRLALETELVDIKLRLYLYEMNLTTFDSEWFVGFYWLKEVRCGVIGDQLNFKLRFHHKPTQRFCYRNVNTV